MLESYLTKFARQFSIDEHKVLKSGVYELTLSDSSLLLFRERDPGVYFESTIMLCPDKKLEALFCHLMAANFLGQGTGGMCIGLNDEGKYLTLSVDLPYDMEYKQFLEVVEDLINYREYWKEEIHKQQTEKEGLL